MLKRSLLSLSFVALTIFGGFAQQLEDKTVLTIGDNAITAGEFMRVYNKNLNLVADAEQRKVDNYLDLYIDYKLKVAEAYDMGLDQTEAHKTEYRKYKHKLATTYMNVGEVTDGLMKEAFKRQQEEIRARHIVISVTADDLPQDTLAAYNKAVKLRQEIIDGKRDFENAARQFSGDPSAADTGGDLGWFSVFKMVYPFETVAYNTPVGEISEIVRTQFGYHFIEVLDRRLVAKQVTVAHIMISPKQDDPNFDAEARINELYGNIQQGASFEDLARQYSDDKNTAQDGGKLSRFGPGMLNAENFERAAFSLENPGDMSKPLQTDFGWHIIKLLERHEYPTFEEVEPRLKQKVQQAQRLDFIKAMSIQELKARYNVTTPDHVVPFFADFLTDSIKTKTWKYTDSLNPAMKTEIFNLNGTSFTYDDFARFIEERQRKSARKGTTYGAAKTFYSEFELATIRDFFKDNLDKEDQGFANIVQEYKEGLLIFDLMESEIWGKVRKDSTGLEAFYNDQIENYQYKPRVVGLVASTPNESVAKKVRKALKKGATLAELQAQFNTENETQVIFSQGTYAAGHRLLPEAYKLATGVSKVYNKAGQFTVIRTDELLAPTAIPLETIRGRVMGDYQAALESTFMERLKKKFKVKIDQAVLKEIKAQL
ncbi:peptidylprolyl isomerase [Gilvibacter sediminis]|uniref:peptidylprolyl isomerase n=1 Tax=Gilvibacter sediminis TaxID=379071 RepID=UPI002350127C|nr:peptidylprolyl isomerase [Gilvibacter sediminis]MDC7999207.1 peptidylprolyl isomerase [Gilvibacter sediminis]